MAEVGRRERAPECPGLGLLCRGSADRRIVHLGRSQCPTFSRNMVLWEALRFPISPSPPNCFEKVHSGADFGKAGAQTGCGCDRHGHFPTLRSQSGTDIRSRSVHCHRFQEFGSAFPVRRIKHEAGIEKDQTRVRKRGASHAARLPSPCSITNAGQRAKAVCLPSYNDALRFRAE